MTIDGIIVYTQAYNAEKTIRKAMDSILNQSYGNLIYYVLDNGSTDGTLDIISEYAKRDDRIKVLHNDVNNIPDGYEVRWFFVHCAETYPDAYVVCTLDADDEYKLDFLEKMIAFMSEKHLDIAACGSDFVDAKTGRLAGVRCLSQEFILEGDRFAEYFAYYHQFFRTIWGKLFRLPIIKRCDLSRESFKGVSYGWDTMFVLKTLRQAARVGVFAESLYKYYVSSQSVSYKLFDKRRIVSDRILHEAAHNFLIEKCGTVSPQNEDFLFCVYMNALKDTLNVLLNAQISAQEKIVGVTDIITHEYTGQLMAKDHFGLGIGSVTRMSSQRKELFSTVADWLLALDEVPGKLVDGYCSAGELLSAAVENADAWLFFKKLRVRLFFEQSRMDEARVSLNELVELIPNDPDVMELQQSF